MSFFDIALKNPKDIIKFYYKKTNKRGDIMGKKFNSIFIVLLLVFTVISTPVNAIDNKNISNSSTFVLQEYSYDYYIDIVKKSLVQRKEDFSFNIKTNVTPENISKYIKKFIEDSYSIKYAQNDKEGEYIRWSIRDYSAEINYTKINNYYSYDITYHMQYYTTSKQENELDEKINMILSSLINENDTEYGKAKKIYEYVSKNADYDYLNLQDNSYSLKYTAYANLINNTSVCQGYALALYRLLSKAGIENHIVTSDTHMWNIIKIGNYFYNADSTWDHSFYSKNLNPRYFLVPDNEFITDEHIRLSEYNTEEYNKLYPTSKTTYIPTQTDLLSANNYPTLSDLSNNDKQHVHNYVYSIKNKPTCNKTGIGIYQCDGCEDQYEISLDKLQHTFSKTNIPSQLNKEGKRIYTCSVCGYKKIQTLPAIKSVNLSKTKYVYNGKIQVPKLIVLFSDGNKKEITISNLKYKNIGNYKFNIIINNDNYTINQKMEYSIIPHSTSIKSIKSNKKAQVDINVSKFASEVSGYQIQYSDKSDMKKSKSFFKTKNVKTTVIKKLKSKKKYYFRVRTYKIINNKKIYSDWSTIKNIKTK